ncbi:hypothetical protein F5884DRAFT_754015 [Xylogone sp. PMI_703]|nr:hypothetical protein F5884DRAFT_754015 [Xylogone sp. PMI_703]
MPLPLESHDLGSVLDSVLVGSNPVLRDLNSDSALMILIGILSEIITLSTVFSTLLRQRQGSGEPSRMNYLGSQDYHNPYLPHSIEGNTTQARGKFHRALSSWEENCMRIVDSNVRPLFYFSKLCLEFPNLPSLLALSRYPQATCFNWTSRETLERYIIEDLQGNTEPLRYSWLILESINESSATSTIWTPIVLFHAGLVVWAMIFYRGKSGVYGSLQVLSLFSKQLRTMRWPCCKPMADTLDHLMNDKS